jgi:hypothetical protein
VGNRRPHAEGEQQCECLDDCPRRLRHAVDWHSAHSGVYFVRFKMVTGTACSYSLSHSLISHVVCIKWAYLGRRAGLQNRLLRLVPGRNLRICLHTCTAPVAVLDWW